MDWRDLPHKRPRRTPPAAPLAVAAPESRAEPDAAPHVRPPARHHDPRRALLFLPPIVLLLTFDAFRGGATVFGTQWGYITGFLFYWIAWCVALPVWVLGADEVRALLVRAPVPRSVPRAVAVPLLAGPPILGFLFVFPNALPSVGAGTLIAFALVAIVNGTLEEIFWRGMYATAFPDRRLPGVVLPAIWFALLQLAPLSAYPGRSLDAAALVVGGAFAVGLGYGWVAWRTRSIRWTIVSHILMNFSGVGAIIYVFAR